MSQVPMNEFQLVRRRTEVEIHIENCRDTAAMNIIEIGRWLNVAKDEGIVGHGEWAAWVQEHAGMSERSAQRAMQAAREIPEGSPLERLGIAKIMSLIGLPAAEREQAAEAMDAEHRSSRDVDQRVQALKRERDEALRVMGAQKRQINDLKAEQANANAQKQQEIDAAVSGAQRALREAHQSWDQDVRELRAREGELQAKIRSYEQQIDGLSDQLDEAQTALARAGMNGRERNNPASRILSAIGALMAEAGQAPGELQRMQGMVDEDTKQLLIGQAQLIGRWAMQVIATCGGDPL